MVNSSVEFDGSIKQFDGTTVVVGMVLDCELREEGLENGMSGRWHPFLQDWLGHGLRVQRVDYGLAFQLLGHLELFFEKIALVLVSPLPLSTVRLRMKFQASQQLTSSGHSGSRIRYGFIFYVKATSFQLQMATTIRRGR